MASPPFSIAETVPADADFVRLFPAAERTFRDIVESWLGRISDATTGLPKIPMDTTANLAALNPQPPIGGMRYDTTVHSLQVKTDASTWVNVGAPAGTVAIFFQETAPLGWTKLTTLGGDFDGSIIELVTGATGGDLVAGTAVGSILTSRTITQANLPDVQFDLVGGTTEGGDHTHSGTTAGGGSHNHGPSAGGSFVTVGGGTVDNGLTEGGTSYGFDAITTTASNHTHNFITDTDGDHSHALDGVAESGGSGTAMDFAVKRVRAILCQKD